jgi:hypothetical protein
LRVPGINGEVPKQALGDKRTVLADIVIEPLRLGNDLCRCPAPPAGFCEPVDGFLEARIGRTFAAESRELCRVGEIRDGDCRNILRTGQRHGCEDDEERTGENHRRD